MDQIIPALLARTHTELHDLYLSLDHAAPHLHLDIADGSITESILFGDPSFITDHMTEETIELHIMMRDPRTAINAFKNTPHVTGVCVHTESEHIVEALDMANEASWRTTIVLSPNSPTHAIETYAAQIDRILIMGVMPGTQGAPWIPDMIEKAHTLSVRFPHITLAWDGGITARRIPMLHQSGVSEYCV